MAAGKNKMDGYLFSLRGVVRRTLPIFVVVVVLGWGAFTILQLQGFGEGVDSPEADPTPVGMADTSSTDSLGGPSVAATSEPNSANHQQISSTVSAEVRLHRSNDLASLVAELETRHHAGDDDAALALAKLYYECASNSRTLQQQVELEGSLRNTGASDAMVDLSWHEHERCRGFTMTRDEMLAEYDHWLGIAGDDMHPEIVSEALLLQRNPTEEFIADVFRSALGSGHPGALKNIADYVGSRGGARAQLQANALLLLACDLGLPDCRPGSAAMVMACEGEASACNPDQSMRDYLYEFELSPAEASGVSSLYSHYVALLQAGELEELIALLEGGG